MKKLTGRDMAAAYAYAAQEPEFNLFFIGDLEIYGLDSENVSLYTSDSWNGGIFPYLLLDYRNNFLIYSHTPDYACREVADYLSTSQMRNLSGKLELVEPLIPLLKDLEIVPAYLARLDSVSDSPAVPFTAGKLGASDVPAIYDLLIQIEEFFTIASKPKDEAMDDILESITRGGRMYGIYEDGSLVATAGTSAENSMSAMIVSVATLPAFRHKGYASHLVAALCKDCLEGGMKFICLFYDNPEAGAIYRKIGFCEIGQYAMVRTSES